MICLTGMNQSKEKEREMLSPPPQGAYLDKKMLEIPSRLTPKQRLINYYVFLYFLYFHIFRKDVNTCAASVRY